MLIFDQILWCNTWCSTPAIKEMLTTTLFIVSYFPQRSSRKNYDILSSEEFLMWNKPFMDPPSAAACFCSAPLAFGCSSQASFAFFQTPAHPGSSKPLPASDTSTQFCMLLYKISEINLCSSTLTEVWLWLTGAWKIKWFWVLCFSLSQHDKHEPL